MTPEQKQALLNHAELYGPASTSRNDDGDFFMTDGEVVKFTNCIRYDANSKYEINNEPFHMIWFSQLNRVFLDDDFNLKGGIIKIGDEEKPIREYKHYNFWRAIRGKTFRVQTEEPSLTFNMNSRTYPLRNADPSTLAFLVKSLVQDDAIEMIGDILKKSVLYNLMEI